MGLLNDAMETYPYLKTLRQHLMTCIFAYRIQHTKVVFHSKYDRCNFVI